MAVDFSAFDEQVDLNELQKEVQEADDSQFDDVPDGTYEVSFDKMEIKQTKAKDKLMFSVQCSILAVSYTHLRAHETDSYLVCRLLLEKKKNVLKNTMIPTAYARITIHTT